MRIWAPSARHAHLSRPSRRTALSAFRTTAWVRIPRRTQPVLQHGVVKLLGLQAPHAVLQPIVCQCFRLLALWSRWLTLPDHGAGLTARDFCTTCALEGKDSYRECNLCLGDEDVSDQMKPDCPLCYNSDADVSSACHTCLTSCAHPNCTALQHLVL